MQGLKLHWIAVTMLVTFCVAFGALMWQQRSETAALSGIREPPRPTDAASRPLMNAAPVPAPTPPAAATPSPQPEAAPTPPPLAPQASTSSEDAPELPVRVLFRHPPKLDRTIARVLSSADQPLTVEWHILSPSTRRDSSGVLALVPSGQAIIGDTGEDLRSGDRVTLRSESFREFTAQVP